MSGRRRAAIGVAAVLLAGCAAKPAPPAAPLAVPPPPPIVVDELPPPPGEGMDWSDRPLTPGDWSYASRAGGSEARFGPGGGAHFGLRCDSARRQIVVEGSNGPLRVRTTYGVRTLPPGAALAAADPLLDEMAFSRGRFAVEREGAEALIVPTWPEPARVIEDCRG